MKFLIGGHGRPHLRKGLREVGAGIFFPSVFTDPCLAPRAVPGMQRAGKNEGGNEGVGQVNSFFN